MKKCCLILVILFLAANLYAQNANILQPQVYQVSAAKIQSIKSAASANKIIAANIQQLAKQGDKLLNVKFGSVMDKKFAPPCGNMHEYFSLAKYFWPDPSKPDGKPYIRKDGQKNPAIDVISDDKNFDEMLNAIHILSWSYYFTDDDKYAAKSIDIMRMWFLDTATRMLPNLNHAQLRTGIDTGSNSGLIDTHSLPQVIDAIGVLRSSKLWKPSDEQEMKAWFKDYLIWLQTSKNGKKEAEAKNNHGTFYDLQIASIALYCGEDAIADAIFKSSFNRLAYQIDIDGKQPLELERTLSLSYSLFNLEAWSLMANVAETKSIDLWHYETADGRSIRKALDYIIPFAVDGKEWQSPQIKPYKPQDLYRLLLIAAEKFKDDRYKAYALKIKDGDTNVFIRLFNES